MKIDIMTIVNIIVLSINILISIYFNTKTYKFNKQKDYNNKIREIRIEYLISAYKDIEDCIQRKNNTKKNKHKFEKAFGSIQLLGNPEEIKVLQEFMSSIKSHSMDADKLLKTLRHSLRKELGLNNDIPHLKFLRFTDK